MSLTAADIQLLRYLAEHCTAPDNTGSISIDRHWSSAADAKTVHAKALSAALHLNSDQLEALVSRLQQFGLVGKRRTSTSFFVWITAAGQDACRDPNEDRGKAVNEPNEAADLTALSDGLQRLKRLFPQDDTIDSVAGVASINNWFDVIEPIVLRRFSSTYADFRRHRSLFVKQFEEHERTLQDVRKHREEQIAEIRRKEKDKGLKGVEAALSFTRTGPLIEAAKEEYRSGKATAEATLKDHIASLVGELETLITDCLVRNVPGPVSMPSNRAESAFAHEGVHQGGTRPTTPSPAMEPSLLRKHGRNESPTPDIGNAGKDYSDYKPATWEKITVTGAACAVVSLVAWLVIRNAPFNDPNLVVILRIVLSLAIAALGAAVPGFLGVGIKGNGLVVRAGGALALFVISFFFTPQVITPPSTDKSSSNGQSQPSDDRSTTGIDEDGVHHEVHPVPAPPGTDNQEQPRKLFKAEPPGDDNGNDIPIEPKAKPKRLPGAGDA